jgi:DNA-binding response OmpR family regulator
MATTTALDFLLVSNNYQTLTAVADGLQRIGASFDFVPTTEAGRDFIGRRKVDGIIVDLDLPGAQDLIHSIRQGLSNQNAVVFACLPGGTKSPAAAVTGATFFLQHPLTPESVASRVSAAQGSMLQERRRYFRYPLSLAVRVTSNGVEQRAMMTNLSEAGMALRTTKAVQRPEIVEFVFKLPSGDSIAGKGMIAWANSEGMAGVKFQILRDDGQQILQKWLQECQRNAPEDPGPGTFRRVS